MSEEMTNLGIPLSEILEMVDENLPEEKRKLLECFACRKLMRNDPCNPRYPVGGSLIDNSWASRFDTWDRPLYICDDCFEKAFGEAYRKWESS